MSEQIEQPADLSSMSRDELIHAAFGRPDPDEQAENLPPAPSTEPDYQAHQDQQQITLSKDELRGLLQEVMGAPQQQPLHTLSRGELAELAFGGAQRLESPPAAAADFRARVNEQVPPQGDIQRLSRGELAKRAFPGRWL
ncbi:MAG: hypothetical protein ACK55H_09755 [Cyanobacteriota bacterium]|jgi:hypothetical protein